MIPKLPSFEMLKWSKLLTLVFAIAIMVTSVYIKDLMDQIILLEKSLHLVQLDIKSTQRKQETNNNIIFVIIVLYLYEGGDGLLKCFHASVPVLNNFLNTLETMFYKIRSVLEKESKRRKFYEMSN